MIVLFIHPIKLISVEIAKLQKPLNSFYEKMVKRSAPFYLLSCVLVWFMISSVSAVTDEDKQVY